MIYGKIGFAGANLDKRIAIMENDILGKVTSFSSYSNFVKKLVKLDTKILACGLHGKGKERFGEKLWINNDVVPVFSDKVDVSGILEGAKRSFEGEVARVNILDNRVIDPSFLTTVGPYRSLDSNRFNKLRRLSKVFNRKVLFISSTPRGGGVALMRHALIRLARQLRLDFKWAVLIPDKDVFFVTKNKFHNVLQGISNYELNKDDIKKYESWIKQNYELLKPIIREVDIIVIDDPQPSGLIRIIRSKHKDKRIVFRSHIHIDLNAIRDGAGKITWNYLSKNVTKADVFISHPISDFIPRDVVDKTIFFPATTDPFDGLNKSLDDKDMRYYYDLFNRILKDNGFSPLDLDRPYIIQVARFDPAKGIRDVLEAYYRFRRRTGSNFQLVLTGNTSVDDPESDVVYEDVVNLVNSRYKKYKDDIKYVRVPHVDQILNTLLRGAFVALQLSYREGFEVKVTEAIMKGIPVIAYATGGIVLQIKNCINGFLVPPGNVGEVANLLERLYNDRDAYNKMRDNALNSDCRRFHTLANLLRWVELFSSFN